MVSSKTVRHHRIYQMDILLIHTEQEAKKKASRLLSINVCIMREVKTCIYITLKCFRMMIAKNYIELGILQAVLIMYVVN